MTRQGRFLKKAGIAVLAIAFFLLPHAALAHAVLVRSTPAQHATVKPGDLAIRLTYNSRIDASRSSLTLLGPAGKTQTLSLQPSQGPNVLATKADGLTEGAYTLRWQVLASDGHITRGVVDFLVHP